MADLDQILKVCGQSQECFAAMWAQMPLIERFWFMIEPQLINLFQAIVALAMLVVCEFVGAKIYKIKLIEAIDRVEENAIAYCLFSTGRFIGACLVISAAWSI